MKLNGSKLINAHVIVALWILFSSLPVQAEESNSLNPKLKPLLNTALQAKGEEYQPSTSHLLANGQPKYINRLILEDSPYLLQHAHNPVNWYAWGDEAFEAAKKENKAIFLSIGYSTCFWCHVMERESFENEQIADLLNTYFINIKVDRERRPDVDAVYMSAVTLITGSGGWPMSSFLTPEGKTFIGGTYFTTDKFKNLINKINELWQQQPEMLTKKAEQVAAEVEKQFASQQQAKKIDSTLLTKAVDTILYQHDSLNGGFGHQPKFPHETWLLYLLESHLRFGNATALKAAEKSLQAMSQGGIYDHIGGGFHRYSTDYQWLIPHFEKMLYNQAQLSRVYLLAYQITGKKHYAQIAAETLDYALEQLRSKDGGFYSATDADDQAGEGGYFLWTKDQINLALSADLATLANNLYSVSDSGNFSAKNVLHLAKPLAMYAELNKLELTKLETDYQTIKTKLKQQRLQRVTPFTDSKVLTAWNSMMIQSLALASEILGEDKYLTAAKKTANFIWDHQDEKTEILWRVYLQGRTSIPANQEDYAYYAEALIKLYDVTGEKLWLDRAQQITDKMVLLFWDTQHGGFFMNTASNQGLMVRPKAIKDTEIAAANAVAMHVLSQLSNRLGNPEYEEKANQLLAAFSAHALKSSIDHSYLLSAAADFLLGEQGTVQFAAKGAVAIKAYNISTENKHEVEIEINMNPKWHINAQKPLQNYLIPTAINLAKKTQGWKLVSVDYPEPIIKTLNFQRQNLALYEETIKLRATLQKINHIKNPETLIFLKVNLQSCNDKVCLPPEELFLPVSLFHS